MEATAHRLVFASGSDPQTATKEIQQNRQPRAITMPHQTQLEISSSPRAAVGKEERVVITTDGGCWPNTGAGSGGWAAIVRRPESADELRGYELATTNNRMELKAVLEGLRWLKTPSSVEVRTDSKYVKHCCEVWCWTWAKHGWKLRSKGSRGQDVKNRDIISAIMEEMIRHKVNFVWIRGHNGDPDNERCDQLAGEMVRMAIAENKGDA